MPESPLYDLPAQPAALCPRCGGLFEAAVTVERDGETVRLPGHVQGDPKSCMPPLTVAEGLERDARRRREIRRGLAPRSRKAAKR